LRSLTADVATVALVVPIVVLLGLPFAHWVNLMLVATVFSLTAYRLIRDSRTPS